MSRRRSHVDIAVFWKLVTDYFANGAVLSATGVMTLYRDAQTDNVTTRLLIRSHLPERPWGTCLKTVHCPQCGGPVKARAQGAAHASIRLGCPTCLLKIRLPRPEWLHRTTSHAYTFEYDVSNSMVEYLNAAPLSSWEPYKIGRTLE